jgi:hypothetical protein
VRFRAGETWDGGAPQSQPDWDAHEAFVDALVEDGTIVMGGPFSDHTGAMLLMDGLSAAEARRIVQLDPFVKNGVFVVDDVRDWTLYVGAA